ncbi:MAG: GGDEF domain-containing protein [Terracidiphilus sp.]
MDLSKIPDVAAVALLTLAFFSVARHGRTSFSGVWLIGWLMIVLHFAAFMFLPAPGNFGIAASVLGSVALAWAGILFMWAAVPYRARSSSQWMLVAIFATNTLYVLLASIAPAGHWLLAPAAVLLGALPLLISLSTVRKFNHPLRWTLVLLYVSLSVFLLMVQNRPGDGLDLALNAVFFTVYLGCCIHFWYAYRRATAGTFITVFGFLAWANVFTVAPFLDTFFPGFHLESEVWNLPKYVVAVGMILILLEDQIEHNKYLALHDELTGLPNRRLFQDRLENTLERARRTGSQAALLLIDLDRFKQVNDTVGHHIGDELLKHVGQLFLSRVRRTDTVARTGGDEFSVVLEEPMNRADAMSVVRTFKQLLESPIRLEGNTVHIGASVGVAIFPDDAGDAESLCISADLRMYASKRSARTREGRIAPAPLLTEPFSPTGADPDLQLAD